ncbi:MAG: hypothetical protein PHS74_04985 [Lachnospiraceae bacterium]|nr:hypothetical protein [Lachnospiraceae bacterium]
MKLPFFASFIVFVVWLTYELKKHQRINQKAKDSFWEIEAKANSTRRKSLEKLSYITIPFEHLPMDLLTEDTTIQDIHKTLDTLKTKQIVNLTGFTNTQLKLEYGAPNINLLTEYDQNYTSLARTLQTWADYLYKKEYIAEAKTVLEFAVSTKTDVSKTYKLLADIYFTEGNFQKIEELITVASTLNSAMKNSIVRTLKELYLFAG